MLFRRPSSFFARRYRRGTFVTEELRRRAGIGRSFVRPFGRLDGWLVGLFGGPTGFLKALNAFRARAPTTLLMRLARSTTFSGRELPRFDPVGVPCCPQPPEQRGAVSSRTASCPLSIHDRSCDPVNGGDSDDDVAREAGRDHDFPPVGKSGSLPVTRLNINGNLAADCVNSSTLVTPPPSR